ncbi:type II toxin-antitoxin system HicB family antitoxin [Thioalkalicoccus limnaeus]|uniref:Type II toxin-antitoxin system HicB family antitoxin n=1 Tax=Thioalkalicoccus limnaeus TaxID=120681 RepID=A0ABV4BGN9_9GAMM
MKDYHVNIFYSDEDEGYIADIPDLKACSAFGETPNEAFAEVLKAKESWLASAAANGKPVPPPEYRPVIYRVA